MPAPESWLDAATALLKREDEHELGAFKWRGAMPVVAEYRRRGHDAVVTASTGNHGAATAWASARAGLRAIVFVPERCSEAKLALLRTAGADVRQVGADLDQAKDAAAAFAAEQGLPFFQDGAEPAQFQGYGAIADEILRADAGCRAGAGRKRRAAGRHRPAAGRARRRPPAGSGWWPRARR